MEYDAYAIEVADTVVSTEDATIAVVNTYVEDGYLRHMFSASGTSRRDPVDPYDAEIGTMLALGRAHRQLGRDLLKRANKLVREQERRKQQQKEASLAAKEIREKRAKAAKTKAGAIPAARKRTTKATK